MRECMLQEQCACRFWEPQGSGRREWWQTFRVGICLEMFRMAEIRDIVSRHLRPERLRVAHTRDLEGAFPALASWLGLPPPHVLRPRANTAAQHYRGQSAFLEENDLCADANAEASQCAVGWEGPRRQAAELAPDTQRGSARLGCSTAARRGDGRRRARTRAAARSASGCWQDLATLWPTLGRTSAECCPTLGAECVIHWCWAEHRARCLPDVFRICSASLARVWPNLARCRGNWANFGRDRAKIGRRGHSVQSWAKTCGNTLFKQLLRNLFLLRRCLGPCGICSTLVQNSAQS